MENCNAMKETQSDDDAVGVWSDKLLLDGVVAIRVIVHTLSISHIMCVRHVCCVCSGHAHIHIHMYINLLWVLRCSACINIFTTITELIANTGEVDGNTVMVDSI